MTDHIPKAGDPLVLKDVENIVQAIQTRQQNFPGEPVGVTIALVLMNIGDRYSPVECIEQEWKGLRMDVPKGDGEGPPTCPNGHPLEKSPGLTIGWLNDI